MKKIKLDVTDLWLILIYVSGVGAVVTIILIMIEALKELAII